MKHFARALVFAMMVLSAHHSFAVPVKHVYGSETVMVQSSWTELAGPLPGLQFEAFAVVPNETKFSKNGGWMGNNMSATPFYPRIDANGYLTIQLQTLDGVYNKCTFLQFKIENQFLYVKHLKAVYKSNVPLGYDFETQAKEGDSPGYRIGPLVYTLQENAVCFTVAGSPSNIGTPDPDYGVHYVDLNETVSFSAPAEGVVTNLAAFSRYVYTGWRLSLTNGTESSGQDLQFARTMDELSCYATQTWTFAQEDLPGKGAIPGYPNAVYMVTSDASTTNSFLNPGHWSDHLAPHADADYLLINGDDGGWMRTPTTIITSSGSETDLTFAGQSLQIGTAGTPGNFYVTHAGYANLNIADLRLVSGTIWAASNDNTYYYNNGGKKQLIKGQATVTSTVDDPFTFAPMGSAVHSGIHLSANLVGDETAAIRCLNKNASGNSAYMHLSIAGDNSEYHGRFIIEGGGAYLWPGWCSCSETTFGATPKTFMKDCIILKNGGAIHTEVSGNFTLKGTNRGIWVIGSASFSSQGGYTVAMPVGGGKLTGSLGIWPHVHAMITFNAPITCYPVTSGGGITMLGADCTVDDTEPWVVNGGFLGTAVDRTLKVKFQSGGFYLSSSVNSAKIPVLTLAEGSIWNGTSVILRLSAGNLPITNMDPEQWYALLKVPLSVKDLSTVTLNLYYTVNYQNWTTLKNAQVKIETDEDGMQTVYARPPRYYVVHPDNRPSGHAAKWPYTSWETAATDITTAVTNAEAHCGGFVFVDRGVYDIRTPIPFAQKGHPTSLMGVNRETMEDDAEHVILDGGYPARTNMLFSLSTTGGCSIRSMTLTHAARYNKDGNWGGGGVAYLQSSGSDFLVTGCRLVENWAYMGGCFQMSRQTVSNCVFIGNTAQNNCSCIASPQGSAGVNETPANVIDCTFISNGVTGAPNIYGGRNARFVGCRFYQNGKKGNNLFGWNYYCYLKDCVFDNNFGLVSCGYNPSGLQGGITIRNTDVSGSTLLSIGDTGADVYSLTLVSNKCSRLLYTPRGIRHLVAYGNVCSSEILSIEGGSKFTYALESMTVADNVAPVAIRVKTTSNATRTTLLNSIVYGNKTSAGALADSTVTLGSRIFSVENTCYEGTALDAYADATSFKRNPLFTPTYGIQGVSRCRDAGANQDWMTLDMTDMAGGPRRLNRQGKKTDDAIVDMGAYESSTPMPGFIVVFR